MHFQFSFTQFHENFQVLSKNIQDKNTTEINRKLVNNYLFLFDKCSNIKTDQNLMQNQNCSSDQAISKTKVDKQNTLQELTAIESTQHNYFTIQEMRKKMVSKRLNFEARCFMKDSYRKLLKVYKQIQFIYPSNVNNRINSVNLTCQEDLEVQNIYQQFFYDNGLIIKISDRQWMRAILLDWQTIKVLTYFVDNYTIKKNNTYIRINTQRKIKNCKIFCHPNKERPFIIIQWQENVLQITQIFQGAKFKKIGRIKDQRFKNYKYRNCFMINMTIVLWIQRLDNQKEYYHAYCYQIETEDVSNIDCIQSDNILCVNTCQFSPNLIMMITDLRQIKIINDKKQLITTIPIDEKIRIKYIKPIKLSIDFTEILFLNEINQLCLIYQNKQTNKSSVQALFKFEDQKVQDLFKLDGLIFVQSDIKIYAIEKNAENILKKYNIYEIAHKTRECRQLSTVLMFRLSKMQSQQSTN